MTQTEIAASLHATLGALGLRKMRLRQAVQNGTSPTPIDAVRGDDRCAPGRLLHENLAAPQRAGGVPPPFATAPPVSRNRSRCDGPRCRRQGRRGESAGRGPIRVAVDRTADRDHALTAQAGVTRGRGPHRAGRGGAVRVRRSAGVAPRRENAAARHYGQPGGACSGTLRHIVASATRSSVAMLRAGH